MTYDSEVLADSPWFYGKSDEASGSILDSSGNGRNLTLGGGSPTYGQTGPGGAADAELWPDSSGATEYYATSSVAVGSTLTALTLECWFYISALPTHPTPLVGVGYGFGNTSLRPAFLWLDTDGTIKLWWGSSSSSFTVIGSASAVSTSAWHHCIGSLTSTAGKVRLDKVDVASGSHATAIASSGIFMLRGGHNGSGQSTIGDHRDGSAVLISKPALYLSTLTDTRTDAHHDAMVGGGATTGTLSATLPTPVTAAFTGTYRESGTFSATLPQVTASLSGTYTAPPAGDFAATLPSPLTTDFAGTYTAPVNPTGSFAATLPTVAASFAGDYHPHEAGTFDAVLPFPTADFAGTYTPGLESGSFAATLPVVTADFAGTYTSPSGTTGTFAATLPLVVAAFTGTYDGPTPTDTSNALNGRVRRGSATVTITRPVATVPPSVSLGQRYDKALAFPEPVMVDGRPT